MKDSIKSKKALKYIAVLLVAVIVVVIVRFFASRKQVEYVPPTPAVEVVYPVRGNIDESLVLSAHIEARAMVPVIPMVNGTILEYPAVAGNFVKKGELLAQIDTEPFRQQVLQAKAAYKGYESSFNRVAGLYNAGAATRQEYDTLKSQRDAAKAQYDLASLQLGYASVSSPVDGTIIAAPMAVGNVAGAPNPIAIVADLDDLVIRLNVPEKYYPVFVRNKDNLTATVERPDYEHIGGRNSCDAVVDTIAPYIDGTSKTFEAVFKLENVPVDFKPGMFVEIKVKFNEYKNVCLIPRNARLNDGTVYTFEKEEIDVSENAENNKDVSDVISGKVNCITLNDYVSDSKWLMVPENYADTLFVVKGQNNVLSGQSANAKQGKVVWTNTKGAK